MKFRFTTHAKSQLLDRGIIPSRAVETVRKPDWLEPAPGNVLACRKLFEDGILEVICVKSQAKNEYLIITAYYR